MKQEIIDKMTQIVESKMQSYKIDFYKYEKDLINGQLNEENKYNINIEQIAF